MFFVLDCHDEFKPKRINRQTQIIECYNLRSHFVIAYKNQRSGTPDVELK